MVTHKLRGLSSFRGHRILDVGCGDGIFTVPLALEYKEVYGIDLQETWLRAFRQRVRGDTRYIISCMSASQMAFPNAHFDTLVTIETIEHIEGLPGAAAEFARVLRTGGELLITCPNRLFPFENHGLRLGQREHHGRVPLLPWIPVLHDRLSLARVFTVRGLDSIFVPHGFVRRGVDYIWPTFEHGGNRFQPALKRLFGMMRAMENSAIRRFGTSIVARYERVA